MDFHPPISALQEPLPGHPWLMVLDPSPTICRVLEVELTPWQVIAYHTPLDACQYLYQHSAFPPQALLLELVLPQVDGFAVARALRTSEHFASLRGLPLLALTLRDHWADRLKVHLAGIDGYLSKPFRIEQVRALLRQILADRGAGHEWMQPKASLPPDPAQCLSSAERRPL